MKKYFVFAAAALVALASCSRVDIDPSAQNGPEVGFQVANYMSSTKAIAGAEFPKTETFSTYAWFSPTSGTPNQAFMTNQTISYQTDTWKAVGRTYYWPKTGKIDFVSYYPTSATPWLTITDNVVDEATTVKNGKISANVSAIPADADYMYSDKAVGMSSNGTNDVTDDAVANTTDNAYAGVPTLFHHALARVAVIVKTARIDDGKADDVKTTFSIELKSAKITNVNNAGSLVMTLNTTKTDGTEKVFGWTLPTNAIWTPTDQAADMAGVVINPLTVEGSNTIAETTVLPQAVGTTTDGKAIELEYTVTTTPAGGQATTEDLSARIYLSKSVDLQNYTNAAFTTITKMGQGAPNYWAMNTKTTYTVTIDPMTQEVTFDPAVASWTINSATPVAENDIL